jgi:hypothetical protein
MPRRYVLAFLLAASIALTGCTAPPATDTATRSPYADHLDSQVRGLSAEEIEGLLTGAGMGFALAAEVNGWPGPLHALELRDELDLSQTQVETLQALREGKLAAAVPLGEQILAAHERLEDGFRSGAMDEERLAADVAHLESLYAELRIVHLRTHLEAYPVFTDHQRMEYDRLRGYGDGHDGHANAGHGH